jgi:hypothetical protein
MAGHHAIEPIAKSIAEIACDAVGLDLTHHQTLVATPECNQSNRVPANLIPSDDAFSLFRSQSSRGQKLTQIRIAAPVLRREENHGPVINRYLSRAKGSGLVSCIKSNLTMTFT